MRPLTSALCLSLIWIALPTAASVFKCAADKGEVVWRYKARAAIWGTSPLVDGRLVFGDKAGWLHTIAAEDGQSISELKIGDNINATPAILGGRIYIGAFNGKLYSLK